MPYVQIRLAHNPNTPITVDKKKELISKVTEVIAHVLERNAAAIMVEVIEGDPDNWGMAGQLVSERRKQG